MGFTWSLTGGAHAPAPASTWPWLPVAALYWIETGVPLPIRIHQIVLGRVTIIPRFSGYRENHVIIMGYTMILKIKKVTARVITIITALFYKPYVSMTYR